MNYKIVYRYRLVCDLKYASTVLPVVISANGRMEYVNAEVDNGSAFCVFQPEIAISLGIDIEKGIKDRVSAMGTIIEVYGHEVTLTLGDLSVDLVVYFPSYQHIPRNLLGKQGLLQKFLVGLDDHGGFVYLGYHDDQDTN